VSIRKQLRAGVVTASADETRRLAARLATALPPDAVLALHGDLGVGKTTFVQGLALGFGFGGPVTSPTFNILHLYRAEPKAPGAARAVRLLLHLDAYRLENPHQVAELMLEDFLVSPYCLAVEWPDRIAAWLPADTIHLTLGIVAPGRHRVTLA
jgi:tRNA threonylcarbamoyladenosine biosynthesis protein TsaE